ncbi:MAG: hypothetical protein EOP62_21185 [Sphingomonadales bacterium]|nr:MAG: hypothetical protein EOP62_21185 [Sphingomonadales bacterium]
MKFCLLPLAIALIALPASAQDQPDQEKQICRRIMATGSNMSKRVCHTAAEWRALNARRSGDKDTLRERPMNQQPLGN